MKKVMFNDCVGVNDKIYFFSNQGGLLGEYDTALNTITYLPVIINELYWDMASVDKMCLFENVIYALFLNGKGLIELDLENLNYCYYSLNTSCKPWGNYVYMGKYKSRLFIFTREKNQVIVFDCKKKTLK